MALLHIRDLQLAYPLPGGGSAAVLDIPELSLPEATERAIHGRSGSGKTTFLNVIAGLARPDRGCVEIDGERLDSLEEAARDRLRARKIGIVFQAFHLLSAFTALENVLLPMSFAGRPDRRRATDLLERVGLAERLRHYPRQLSVGQRQRVAVARALVNRPRLVLADEPTGNLDPDSAGETLTLIRTVCREHGASLLLVSHDPAVLAAFPTTLSFAELNSGARA